MRQMMLMVVLMVMVLSTGCGVRRASDVIKAYSTTSNMPSWMLQDEGVVVHDVPSSTLMVHIGPSGIREVSMQRLVCSNRARNIMAAYMGWASTHATTTINTEGETTTTTTSGGHQIVTGYHIGRRVTIQTYYEGGYMDPTVHCVGIVKIKPVE